MLVEVPVCECCGHPLPTLEVQLELTRAQRIIFAAVQRAGAAGIPFRALITNLYREHADGGPLTAPNAVQVQRHKMQPKLAEFGLRIVSSGGHDARWRLEKLSQTERTETTHATT